MSVKLLHKRKNVILKGKYTCCGFECEFDSKYFLEQYELVEITQRHLEEYTACHKLSCPKCFFASNVVLDTKPLLEEKDE